MSEEGPEFKFEELAVQGYRQTPVVTVEHEERSDGVLVLCLRRAPGRCRKGPLLLPRTSGPLPLGLGRVHL